MKYSTCPNLDCQANWGSEEISFQECDCCGRPNVDADENFEDDEGELLGYVCSGCGNIQNTNDGFGCGRCSGHSLEEWYN